MNLTDHGNTPMPEPTRAQQAEYYRLYDRLAEAMRQSPSAGYKPKSRLIHAEVVRRMGLKNKEES